VKVNKKYFRPHDITYLRGNYEKLQNATGWKPKTTLDQIVEEMVKNDIELHRPKV
jgi:GDPmannose 4,6-dehydratase